MSFWQADTKLAIGQKSVSVPAEVQGEYSENGKIVIKIDPSVEFFQPTESYLQFRLKLKLNSADDAMRLQLNPDIGAHSLLRDVRIMSGTGVVLEECIAYNVLVQQMYSYDANENIRRKRALTEGTTLHQPLNRSTTGAERSNRNATVSNPYFSDNGSTTYNADGTTAFTDDSFHHLKICLPLKGSGIFRNPKIFPVMLSQGLRIEIFLEEAKKCITRLITTESSATEAARNLQPPRLLSWGADNAAAGQGAVISTNTFTITAATKAATCRLTTTAGGGDLYGDGTKIKISAVVGMVELNWATNGNVFYYTKKVDATHIDIFTDASLATAVNSSGFTGYGSAGTGTAEAYATFLLTVDNSMSSVGQCPFVVNQSLAIRNKDVLGTTKVLADKVTKVEQVTDSDGTTKRLRITMGANTTFAAAIPTGSYVYDNTPAIAASFNPQFIMDEVQLVMQKIIMPPGYISTMMKSMKENGMIRYDFNAMQTYKYSMLSTDTEGTIMLPLQNSRAKAMLCCPVDASSYTPVQAIDKQQGFAFRGHSDNITEYRFTYNGKMNPDRPVPLSKVNSGLQEQQHLIELDKALAMSGITPGCMREFASNFIVPRALSLQGGSYDTRSKDFQLQVSYRETTVPQLNKLWHIFVSHIRSIVVKQGNLSVQV